MAAAISAAAGIYYTVENVLWRVTASAAIHDSRARAPSRRGGYAG